MPKHRIQGLIKAWAIAFGLCMAGPGGAASNASPTETGAPAPKTRKAKAPKPPADKGYGENRAERDKRLLRECRGKPNAGACEGYAH